MALIRCPECDRDVSDIAKICPHCGFPLHIIENGEQPKSDGIHYARPSGTLPPREKKTNDKKTLFWIILIVIVFCVGSCATNFYGESEQTEEKTAEDFDTYDEYVETVPEATDVVEKSTGEIEETTEEPLTEVAEISMEEYIAGCQEYNYKDVLRNPSDYVGEKVKIVVEISSVHEASWLYNEKYYFCYSDDGSGYFMDNRYAIIDKRYDNSLKLLEEDVILVYGEIAEPEETESLIVNSEELFTIDMRYVELLDE